MTCFNDVASADRRVRACIHARRVRTRGTLLRYGVDADCIDERVPYSVARILRSARPDQRPIEQPTKLELAINGCIARELGLSLPRSLLLQADRVVP